MSKRLARLNEQLKRELSEMIRTEVRDPRVGLVTIIAVDTARDLGSARVYVRVVGGRDEMAATLEGLGAAAPFLRASLGRALRVRKIPELRFREDRSFEHARRIEDVLADVLPADDEGREGDDAEEGEEAGDDAEEGAEAGSATPHGDEDDTAT